jgi:hypothetical protein
VVSATRARVCAAQSGKIAELQSAVLAAKSLGCGRDPPCDPFSFPS